MKHLCCALPFVLLGYSLSLAVKPYQPTYENTIEDLSLWTTYPELSGKGLLCLEIDEGDKLWFGAHSGVYAYDGMEWSEYPVPQDLLGSGISHIAFSHDGALYAGSDRALSRFVDGQWTRILPAAADIRWPVTGLSPASNGGVWVSTPYGVVRCEEACQTAYTDQSGRDWIGSHSPEIAVRDVPAALIATYDLPEGHSSGYVGTHSEFHPMGIFEDSNQQVWVGQALGDIYRFGVGAEGHPVEWANFSQDDGVSLVGADVGVHFIEAAGEIWAVNGHAGDPVHIFNDGAWRHLSLDQVGGWNLNTAALTHSDGSVWIGAMYPQVYKDGAWSVYHDLPLETARIASIKEGRDGSVWFVQRRGKVFRLKYKTSEWQTFKGLFYEGETRLDKEYFLSVNWRIVEHDLERDTWLSYGPEDGLMNFPMSLHVTRDDVVWAMGGHDGRAATAELKGSSWELTEHSDLSWTIGVAGPSKRIGETADGAIWFQGFPTWGDPFLEKKGFTKGIKVKHASHWETLPYVPGVGAGWKTKETQRQYETVGALEHYYGFGQTPDGRIWMGITTGLHTYADGRLTRVDNAQLGRAAIHVIRPSSDGLLWVGTRVQGLFAYDGQQWTNYSIADGLLGDWIFDVEEGPDGAIWAATSGGVSRFDGATWTPQSFLNWNPDEGVRSFRIDSRGSIFLSSKGGPWWQRVQRGTTEDSITCTTKRYRPNGHAPDTQIVQADKHVSSEGNMVIEWSGRDLWGETPTDQLEYAYRIDGGPWSEYSTAMHETFFSLPSGPHTFEVRARDRDYNVDPTPALFSFVVAPPVWQEPWFVGLMFAFVASLSWQGVRIVGRTRERNQAREALLHEAHRELETAQTMQRNLLPEESPSFAGVDVAGRCTPSTHVGGDFIKYVERGGRLFISVADVTGHGMEAAIPVVMFSGILDNHLDEDHSLEDRFAMLNRSLYRSLESRSFVCFAMGELDITGRTMRLGNAGCPSPYHYRSSSAQLVELEHNNLPLGVRLQSEYGAFECDCSRGDYFVFFSDGLVEEQNEAGEQFGHQRLERALEALCREQLPAQRVLNGLLAHWSEFKGSAAQEDDVTCVVIRVVES